MRKKIFDLISVLRRNILSGDSKILHNLMHSRFVSRFAIVLLAVVVTFLATFSLQRIPRNVHEGEISRMNIKADRNYEIIDEEATQKFKDEALGGVLPVYDFDVRLSDLVADRIRTAFDLARELMVQISDNPIYSKNATLKNENQDEDIMQAISEKLGIDLTQKQWEVLVKTRFSVKLEFAIIDLVKNAMSKPLVAERGSLDAEKSRGIVMRTLSSTGEVQDEKTYDDVAKLQSTNETRKALSEVSASTLGFKDQREYEVAIALAQSLVEPNCSLSMTETEKRRAGAAGGIKNVILKVNAGEMIIREGSRFEPWHVKVINGIHKEKRRGMYPYEFIGTLILILLFLIIPFYLSNCFFIKMEIKKRDYCLMALVGLSVLLLMRLSLVISPALRTALFINISTNILHYAIPVAGGAMLVRIFLGAEVTFVFAIVLSAVTGFFIEADVQFATYCLISSLMAIIAISNADRRSLIIRAGFITGVVGSFALIGSRLIAIASATESSSVVDLLWGIAFALCGGLGSAVFALIGSSIVESVSHYTSDIKLLELANLNHPILRELIVRAPGTYHHSHMVGILGEAAAEAVSAKALLVRVAAYYHDIGKMKKPFYFIENAKSGDDRHAKLSPNMSALIVEAHVKDGIDMANKASIPKEIADMIPEHHGTRLVSFFYDKAKQMVEDATQKIDQKDFMYPGPKPQTREAAILMLADAVEASVRSLKEKSSTRIQQTVQRVITDIFVEKQLDDCDLTLKDLNDIARAFVRILLGIYHSRIEYPKDTEIGRPEISVVDESSTNADNIYEQTSQKTTQSEKN